MTRSILRTTRPYIYWSTRYLTPREVAIVQLVKRHLAGRRLVRTWDRFEKKVGWDRVAIGYVCSGI